MHTTNVDVLVDDLFLHLACALMSCIMYHKVRFGFFGYCIAKCNAILLAFFSHCCGE